MDAKTRAIQQAKSDFLTECQQVARNLEQVLLKSGQLLQFWADNDYAAELTVEDLQAYRFSMEELQAFIGLMTQMQKMANNQQIEPANYSKINNQIK